MNFFKLKLTSNLINFVLLTSVIIVFGLFVNSNRHKIFIRFDQSYIDKYMISQDILDTEDRIKNRIFISDEDIYIASGYLYAKGSSPVDYNFQHPPFIKYLFGLSSIYFNLPLLPNIIFAIILLFEIFLLGKLFFKSELVGLLGSLFILFDPIFKEVTIYGLLDLGQIVFVLGFLIISIFYQKKLILQGILLGLATASKFYTPVILLLMMVYVYKLISRKINIKNEFIVLFFSSITFYLCYWKAWPYNIFYHQAKIFKFMIDHNQATNWGGVLNMFFGGYFVWPILFITNLFMLFNKRNSISQKFIYIIPIVYLFIMTFQLPFTRYFIMILPFLYLSLANFIVLKFNYEK